MIRRRIAHIWTTTTTTSRSRSRPLLRRCFCCSTILHRSSSTFSRPVLLPFATEVNYDAVFSRNTRRPQNTRARQRRRRTFRSGSTLSSADTDWMTRVRIHLPQLVEHILWSMQQHDPSLSFQWQQQVSHLQRRRRRNGKLVFEPASIHASSSYPLLEEWETWCRASSSSSSSNNQRIINHVEPNDQEDTFVDPTYGQCISRMEDIDDDDDDGTFVVFDDETRIRHDPETNVQMSMGHSIQETTTTWHHSNDDALVSALALLRVMTASDWTRVESVMDLLNDDGDNNNNNDDNLEDDEDSIRQSTERASAPELVFLDSDISDDEFWEQCLHASTTITTTMEDANVWLARLALTLDLERDDAAALLMHEFTRRCQSINHPPNAISYEILLWTLLHRLEQYDHATLVVEHMLQQDAQVWTPECLTAAIQTWNCRQWWDEAWDLLHTVYHDPTRTFKIQNKTFQIVMEMAISEQRSDEVLRLMDMAMKETKRRSDTNVEKIILLGLNGSYAKERQATEFLTQAMEILEGRTVMVPGDRVWRHFIYVASGKRRQKDKALCALIRRAFDNWAVCAPSFRPSDQFLSIGLDVSEQLRDTKFALDLIVRRIVRSNDGRSQDVAPLPILQIIRAVNICMEHGDVAKGRLILDRCSTHPNIHTAMMQRMYHSVLRGYAEQGDSIAAKELLSAMAESSVPINQESLSVMIRSYALRKDLASATSFLAAVEDGIFEVEPDASIYGSYILTCVRAGAWPEVIDTYNKMKERGLTPTASTVYCLLLAADKVGGTTEQMLHDVVESRGIVDMACCILACTLLLPGFQDIRDMKELRVELRRFTDREDTVRDESLHLLKELRIAELDRGEHSDSSSWRNVLSSILVLVRAMKTGDDVKQYS